MKLHVYATQSDAMSYARICESMAETLLRIARDSGDEDMMCRAEVEAKKEREQAAYWREVAAGTRDDLWEPA